MRPEAIQSAAHGVHAHGDEEAASLLGIPFGEPFLPEPRPVPGIGLREHCAPYLAAHRVKAGERSGGVRLTPHVCILDASPLRPDGMAQANGFKKR